MPPRLRHDAAQAGIDPKTVATMGGWKDVATVMKYYAHAMNDPTVTEALFGTNLTQVQNTQPVTLRKQTRNEA
jgi:integrase